MLTLLVSHPLPAATAASDLSCLAFFFVRLTCLVRYIVASPSAKYNEPQSVFDAPADVVFLCRTSNELTEVEANVLVASGCKTVVDGGYRPVSTAAAEVWAYATAAVAMVVVVRGGGFCPSSLMDKIPLEPELCCRYCFVVVVVICTQDTCLKLCDSEQNYRTYALEGITTVISHNR